MDARELIFQAEQEVAQGRLSAPKTVQRVRRRLLDEGDIQGLEHLLDIAERMEGVAGDLPYAIRQDLRSLQGKAQGTIEQARRSPPSAEQTPARHYPFGDPRRSYSLALALVSSIGLFPIVWFGLLILWALGGGPYTDQEKQHAERVIVIIAAIPPTLGVVLSSLSWLRARRFYSPDQRRSLIGGEGALWAVAVLGAFGAALALGRYLWNTLL